MLALSGLDATRESSSPITIALIVPSHRIGHSLLCDSQNHVVFCSFSRFLIFAFAALDSRRVCGTWYLQACQLRDSKSMQMPLNVTPFFPCISPRTFVHSVTFMDGASESFGLFDSLVRAEHHTRKERNNQKRTDFSLPKLLLCCPLGLPLR